ncbi:MAG: DUF3830 family protein [Chloroflexota bacterium]|nr:MAG: DUF3830 family protein [Chloroflexota bacterium]
MSKCIEFICEEEGIHAKAELMEHIAPEICTMIWNSLPVEGYFHHAYYSGPEVAMVLPDFYDVQLEKPTTVLLPGEIAFTSLRARDYIDVNEDFSEILFFYDRNTGPKMLDGPTKVTIFAHFLDDQKKLYNLCFRMRKEGQKKFVVRRA